MPYFKWVGIDITGNLNKGKRFATSEQFLQDYLLEQEIGLMHAQCINYRHWKRSVSLSKKALFFKQFSKLLHAGLLVPQALSILSKQGYGLLGDVAQEVGYNIERGSSLYQSAQEFSEVFDTLIINLLQAGEESSKLAASLGYLATYLEAQLLFYKQLRRSLMVPLVTLLFFIAVIGIIIIALIPAFERVFVMIGKQPPRYTGYLFALSKSLTSPAVLVWFPIVIFGLLIAGRFFLSSHCSTMRTKIIMRVPVIRRIAIYFGYSYFFKALAVLIEGGVSVIDAITISTCSMGNFIIAGWFQRAIQLLESGNTLSDACLESNTYMDDEALALLTVGEQTGTLSLVAQELSQRYFEKGQKIISTILTIAQPVLMLGLGILIALLILAIYMPLLNIPDILSTTIV